MVESLPGGRRPGGESLRRGGFVNDRRDVRVLAVTSADRLNAGWTAAQRGRMRRAGGPSHVERLMADLPAHCLLVTVIDGHPATLAWLGAVAGHRVAPLGVEHFGQSGTIEDLHAHFGIDADAIVRTVETCSPGRAIGMRPG